MFKENLLLNFKNTHKDYVFHNKLYEHTYIDYQYLMSFFDTLDKSVQNVIFLMCDELFKLNCPNHINLFCTSNENQSKNVFTLPYFLEPINETFEPFQNKKPTVSFCGFISHISRLLCINELNNCNNSIENNFIIRDKFWAGKPHDPVIVSEYRNNIKNSHFVLCNRGAGNWSMRFYHALEAGRIPIIINSGNKLPFDKHIDYEKYIILANNEKDMIKKIMQVWESEDIIKKQHSCHKLYQDWFTPLSFEEKVISYIKEYK
jgi:hypothetical protein